MLVKIRTEVNYRDEVRVYERITDEITATNYARIANNWKDYKVEIDRTQTHEVGTVWNLVETIEK